MLDALAHRGPDDVGEWSDPEPSIWLGHRRLAVLDPSPQGHQPMLSACGRYVIAFNGEIYNHLELRARLEREGGGGLRWRGHSDTETLLMAVSQWDLKLALDRCVGMYAIALWDRQERTLTLARDRLGEKPLYYGWRGDVLLFGSELKALRIHPEFRGEIDRNALALLLRHNYVPAPYTIYRDIYKLPPGTCLTVSASGRATAPVSYWSAREVAERGQTNLFPGSVQEAAGELDALLRQSIRGQMLSDVPLGAFLSGGIDSSMIAALMQAQSARPVKTFTIGFWEKEYNEADHARAVAAHLGTDHTEWFVTEDDALAVVPQLPEIYDEPFADSSQIPTLLVSRLARKQATVSLSGDGGDELFGGYNRYLWTGGIWRRLRWLPAPLRAAGARLLIGIPPQRWDAAFGMLARFLPDRWRYANAGDKLHKLAELFAVRRPEDIYRELVSHWKQPCAVVKDSAEPPTVLTDETQWARLPDIEQRMMHLDLIEYLPGDLLAKIDRAAMRVSLETRVPFLDHRVVEFAWRLPLAMKLRGGRGKLLLRQALSRYVPEALTARPKMGFGVPLDAWLRGPLRDWAEALLDAARLEREGYFNAQPIRDRWREHLSGERNWAYHLWDVLMFQAWHERAMRV